MDVNVGIKDGDRRALVHGRETVVRIAREVYPQREKAGDGPSGDLLTQRMQVHEKSAGMLRSMLA
jgi:starvation-inducible DNA-binding protein